ncbi:hypothetical protein IQ285_12850 [Burkholderia sp. R-69608]|uniref:hypothetical protein n=1 Tax=Paraburkholderia nemoris TaxID=2793076 RepID=UPI001912D5F0|nr:hypothetical protein [Paraburkholderia nemoris]MBK5148571.1 hypothetical protein [Burkholderia sp. R-69608]
MSWNMLSPILRIAVRKHDASIWKVKARLWRGLVRLRAGHVRAYDDENAPALRALGNARDCVTLTAFLAEAAVALARHTRASDASELLEYVVESVLKANNQFALAEFSRAKAETMLCDVATADITHAENILMSALQMSRQGD